MKTHSIVLVFCLVTTVGCLGIGYILSGYWWILPVLLAMGIFWMTTKNRSTFWSASILLVAYVILAVIGVTLNHSIHLTVPGCAAALACWDLIHFRQSIDGTPRHKFDMLLERYCLKSLAIAVVTGLSLAFIGSSINLHFSFGVMVSLVLVAMGCLTYGVHLMTMNR